MTPSYTETNSSKNEVLNRREQLITDSFNNYHVYLVGYIYRLCGSQALAEDVIQDLWIHVYVKFTEEHIQCLPILRRKAWQKYVDHYRKTKRLKEIESDGEFDSYAGGEVGEPFSETEESELKQRFWNEFQGIDLTDTQKNIIWLHARYGYTYAEIEGKTGVSSSSVCDWLQKARSKMSKHLGEDSVK